MISDVTLHVFCAVYIPYAPPLHQHATSSRGHGKSSSSSSSSSTLELGTFRHYDATECAGSSHLLEQIPYTDETRLRQKWLRGPFSPVQGNLDHLLTPGTKIPPELLERQNAAYRVYRI